MATRACYRTRSADSGAGRWADRKVYERNSRLTFVIPFTVDRMSLHQWITFVAITLGVFSLQLTFRRNRHDTPSRKA